MKHARFAVAAIGLSSLSAHAQTSVLVGSVSADSAGKRPIAGAEISIPIARQSARSDSAGSFRINGLARERYTVVVRAIGFRSLTDSVVIQDDDATLKNFVLGERVEALAPVVTTGMRREYISPLLQAFEDRRVQGFGHFLSEDKLRTMEARRLSDVIVGFAPGSRLVRMQQNTYLASSRNTKTSTTVMAGARRRGQAPGACYATEYVDGVLMFDMQLSDSLQTPPNLDDFSIGGLAGVEFYGGEGSAPLGFRHSGCGLLLLWSRERDVGANGHSIHAGPRKDRPQQAKCRHIGRKRSKAAVRVASAIPIPPRRSSLA